MQYKFLHMNKLSYLFLFLTIHTFFAQNTKEIDSLIKVTSTIKNDSIKVSNLNKIAFKYIFNDKDKAIEFLNKSQKLALEKKCNFGYNENINIHGILMDVTGDSDSAFYYFNKSLQLSKKNNFKNLQVRAVNNLGMYYWNTGQFEKALNHFFEALKINDKLPKEQQINYSTCYSNIGLIYQEMDLNEKALEFHKKAYDYRLKNNLNHEISISLNNIAICYHALGKNLLAIENYKKGIQYAKEYGNESEFIKLSENIGNTLQSEHRFQESIKYYLDVENSQNMNPKSAMGIYGGLVAAYNELDQPQKAILYANKGFAILKENPDVKNFSAPLYQFAAQSYYMLGDRKKGEELNREFIGITKDVFSAENAKKIASYETKYEVEKKEKELLKNQIEIKKRTNLIILISIITISIALLGFLLFRQQKLKNKQQEQEFVLKQAIAKIETQNQLQEQRLSISRDLHDNIGAQLTFIISSVDNLKFGNKSLDDKITNQLSKISNFTKATIVELRDTIWAMNSNEFSFEDLRSRIYNFIEKAQSAKEDVQFNFTINTDLKNIKLSAISGINVYRTIQEAVNNSIKYANASAIIIDVKKVNQRTIIEIKDNGIGFDLSNIKLGNGIQNMKSRIEEIGGEFEINSLENKGTLVIITI
jgi:signal transduction histidine kinase